MINPGDVFIYKEYTFEDGSKRDKWFIVLNKSDRNSPCIVLKTTSQNKHYFGCQIGCNKYRKCFFAPQEWQSCFTRDTFIQLPQIIQFDGAVLFQESLSRKIEFREPLTQDCYNKLKSCIAEFKDDVSKIHWNMIFRAK